MRIMLGSLKGGVGKTSSSVILAELLSADGPTLLVDADPQGSAMRWADAAAEESKGLEAVTIALPTTDLPRRMKSNLVTGYDHVVIDTPPGNLAIVQAAIKSVDVVLVPCKPTLMDLDRVRTTIDAATELGTPSAVLLTQTRSNTRALVAAVEALDAVELPVLSTTIPQREAIAAAFGTRPKAEILRLYEPVLNELESALV